MKMQVFGALDLDGTEFDYTLSNISTVVGKYFGVPLSSTSLRHLA